MKTNQIKTVHNRRYMLSSFGLLIAMTGGLYPTQSQGLSEKDFFKHVMGIDYKNIKFYAKDKKRPDPDGKEFRAFRRRKAVREFLKSACIDIVDLSNELKKVLKGKTKPQELFTDDNKKVKVDALTVLEAMKYLTGIYRLTYTTKQKKEAKAKRLEVETFRTLEDAKTAGLKGNDYKVAYYSIAQYLSIPEAKDLVKKDKNLEEGLKKMLPQHFLDILDKNLGSQNKGGKKRSKKEIRTHIAVNSYMSVVDAVADKQGIEIKANQKRDVAEKFVFEQLDDEEEDDEEEELEDEYNPSEDSSNYGLWLLIGGSFVFVSGATAVALNRDALMGTKDSGDGKNKDSEEDLITPEGD